MNESVDIRRIVREAINAPSGDNAQPWRFRVDGQVLTIFNVSENDRSLYNFRQRGSYFAHGALVENICIAASTYGCTCEVTPFPDTPNVTARVRIVKTDATPDPLLGALPLRTTNRKAYERRELEQGHRNELESAITSEDVQLRFVRGPDALKALASTLSINERILMENRDIHDFLFEMIRWTPEEERERTGLYLMTMEFPPPVRFMMQYVLRHWWAVRALNFLGLSRIIPKQSAQGYAESAAFGAIIIRGREDSDFLAAGRAFERVWLTATLAGISLQPVTALPYLWQRVRAHETASLSAKHIRLIEEAHSKIAQNFRLLGEEHIAMLFRVGYDGKPSATSYKHDPRFI